MNRFGFQYWIIATAMAASAVPAWAAPGRTANTRMESDGAGATDHDTTPDSVSVRDFGAKCDGTTLDTAAFQKAIDAARVVTVPAGTCLIDSVELRAGTTLAGAGTTSILKQVTARNPFMLRADSGSSDTADNLRGIVLRDLQLLGTVEKDGFSEHVHLVAVNGVTGMTVERVTFRGFRGDGIYFGASAGPRQPRHNVDVAVRQCVFDGVNNDNRNAISVIDGDGVTIENNRFVNVTRLNMPGAIDFEPNAMSVTIIRNVLVRKNTFSHVGGMAAVVSVYVPAVVAQAAQNVTIEENEATNYVGKGSMIFFSDNRMPTEHSPTNNVKILRNTGRGGVRPFHVFGKGITVRDNTWTDYTQSALLAYASINAVREAELSNNRFVRVGTGDGSCLTAFNVANTSLVGNHFIDCGSGRPGAVAIDFNKGSSSNIVLESNEFRASTGKAVVAVQKEHAHTFAPRTNRFFCNTLDAGMSNFFEAEQADDAGRPGRRCESRAH